MQAGRRAELFSAGPVSIPLYPVKRRKTKILHPSGCESSDYTGGRFAGTTIFYARDASHATF